MREFKAIVVDDEAAARDVVEGLLKRQHPEISVLAKCSDVLEGVFAIRKYNPDVVFLDVQMPEFAGYELVTFFEEINFEIIFITAYDQFAIKAFELSAVDYLVKPIDRSRFSEAIEKLKERLGQAELKQHYQLLLQTMQGKDLGKMVIPELGVKRVIELKDLVAVEAKGAYSNLILRDQSTILISKNLSQLEASLPGNQVFFRSHKSWIINLNCLELVDKGKGIVYLAGNSQARLSKYKVAALYEALEG